MGDFYDSLLSSNPFIDNRVNGLSAEGVDVGEVHRTAFDGLTDLARQALGMRRGLGAVLWGEAGVGKSHLLARLTRWAEADGRAVAVYLHNLQADPDNLPRSLLKSVVSILTHGRARSFRATPLYDLAHAFVAEALDHDVSIKHPWPAVERAYSRLLDGLGREDAARAAPPDRAIYEVIYRFYRSAHRAYKTRDESEARLAVRWLSGDSLEAAEARTVGLPPGRGAEEPTEPFDNQRIKQVLTAVGRLALSGGKPFLLCFDQVDNLDDDQAAALSRFLEALIDAAPNLLVVTAGIQSSLLRWRETGVIQESAWDRLAQFKFALQKLDGEQARRILAARLHAAVGRFEAPEAVRRRTEEDDLFPLGRAWAEGVLRQKIDWRPRDVINQAREAWGREQEALRKYGGPTWLDGWPHKNGVVHSGSWSEEQIRAALDRKLDEKIAEHCEGQRRPGALPPDADNLTGLIAALVGRLGGVEIDRPPSGKPGPTFPYSLLARRPAADGRPKESAGVLVLVNGIARSTTAALRAVLQTDAPADRVFVVADERIPITFGRQPDAKGKEYYRELESRGPERFQYVELTRQQYAQMDALKAVIGMARSGDVEIELPGGMSRVVTEREVIESHRRRGRHLALPVLRELCGGG